MANNTLPPPGHTSPWSLLLASRKVQWTMAIIALVILFTGAALVVFVTLCINGKLTVSEFMTAAFVTLPTAIAGIVVMAKSVVDGISREDSAAKSTPTNVNTVGDNAKVTVAPAPADHAPPAPPAA